MNGAFGCRSGQELQTGILKMKEWFREKTWEQVYEAETADETASIFQNTLLEKLEEIFPEKIRKYNRDGFLIN